jgi:ribosomal protein L37AE/L43A
MKLRGLAGRKGRKKMALMNSWDKIDKNPICMKCGKKAIYNFHRTGFIYSYKIPLCPKCLIDILKKYKLGVWRK